MLGRFEIYLKRRDGAFGIMAALAATVLLLAVAVAIEITNLTNQKQKSQNFADVAALSAARYMSEHLAELTNDSQFNRYSAEAKKHALDMIDAYLSNYDQSGVKTTFTLNSDSVEVTIAAKSDPLMMDLFGVKTVAHQVQAEANLAVASAKDLDLALIADATGSMQITLTGIQDNMKEFTTDLQNELTKHGIELGRVRVKFLFYRDYMADVHQNWTGRDMTLVPGLEQYGPMYESEFYELPAEKNDMDAYVDFFQAQGGGPFKESGHEAVWHSISDSNWRDGEDTVRSIVLWTDATPRPIGDTEELFALTPEPDPILAYFSNDYWTQMMGAAFAALSYDGRVSYIMDNSYPSGMPTSLSDLKVQFEAFHAENANDKSGIKTMAVNIVSSCQGVTPCGEWADVASWDGVDVYEEATVSSSETYDAIIQQVAETVLSQVSARDLALTH